MIVWINGPYGVGKSTLAEELAAHEPGGFVFDAEEMGNAVRENVPKELYYDPMFEGYLRWFDVCTMLLKDLSWRYDGIVYVLMTLVRADSFAKMAGPLRQSGIAVQHVLLESTYDIVRGRILARGEEEDCWCMRHIAMCLEQQRMFEDVIRIPSVGLDVCALAAAVREALRI